MAYGFSFGGSGRYGRSRYNKELTPAGRVFMALMGIIFIIIPFVEYNRFSNLARDGKEAEARVVSYNPTYTHTKNGTRTNHYHKLFFDGSEKRVKLNREYAVGLKFSVVYDTQYPSFAVPGKKGMSAGELMAGGLQVMGALVLAGIAVILAAFFAPSKPGAVSVPQQAAPYSPPPESFSGLAENKAPQAEPGFKPAIETAIPFVPGGPKEPVKEEPQKPAASGFSKYGEEVMDEGYRLFKDHAEFAAAALAEKYGHLTKGQASEVIAKADALDYAAEDEANNVQGGLYTADKAAANLMKTNPGFSEVVYKQIITEKMKP